MSAERGYRADIDGLRTIAVVPVVLFHAGVTAMGGGYVGVDIFFVISGYLITGILLKSIAQDRFSIQDFYVRRIKRIFPALLLVLAATTLAAWFIFPPQRLVDYGKSLAAVSIFASNFHFWQATDYFSANAHLQPLLHTWSLAVEEQFYIFYPIGLYLLVRMRWPVVPILLIVGGLSLLAACALLVKIPGAVFYQLPFRAWELAIGGLLAAGFPPPIVKANARNAAAWGGMALMIAPILLYQSDTPFPGLATLPPTLGAALVIWSGQGGQTQVHRLLATGPFVGIGKASYSFYLWHFPIFAFAIFMLNRPLDWQTGLLLSAIALAAAFATLFLLETPARKATSRGVVAIPVALMAAFGLGGLWLVNADGFPGRFGGATAGIIAMADDGRNIYTDCMSLSDKIVQPKNACALGSKGKAPTLLLWGDSHSLFTAHAMEIAAKQQGASFLYAATADCPPGLGFSISPRFSPELTHYPAYQFCKNYNARMLALAKSRPEIKTIVISARWTNWRVGAAPNQAEAHYDIRLADAKGDAASYGDNARIFKAGFQQLIGELAASGKHVMIVGPLPEPGFDVPDGLYVERFGFYAAPKYLAFSRFETRHRAALQMLAEAARLEGVRLIWPHRLLCQAGRCPIAVGGKPLYSDHNHLSKFGASLTAPAYRQLFATP